MVGLSVGTGVSVGDVGPAEVEGLFVGDSEGLVVGLWEGTAVGSSVGLDVGTFVGLFVGDVVGDAVVGLGVRGAVVGGMRLLGTMAHALVFATHCSSGYIP